MFKEWKENIIKRLCVFLILIFNLLASPSTVLSASLCSQILTPKTFESLRAEFVQTSSPISRMHNFELETALSRLEQGRTEEGDLLTILNFGDPISIAATQDWDQHKTESILRQIVKLLEEPESQRQILSGELLIKNFFKQGISPWFGLIPKELLSQLVLASLGSTTAPSPSDRVILPHLPELITALGVESPMIQTLALRALNSPYYSLSLLKKIHLFPESIRAQFALNWRVDEGQTELLIGESLLLSSAQKTQLVATKEMIACGTCPEMSRGHFEPFFKDNAGRGTALILYRGELMGLLKTTGDPSFLALRDVKNKNGELVLLTGGVYLPPLWMQNELEVSGPGMSPQPLQFLDLFTSAQNDEGLKPLSFYPKMFTKTPLESHQMPGSFQSLNPPARGSIRRSFGFSMAPVEIVMGQEFKNGVRELRSRAQASLESRYN